MATISIFTLATILQLQHFHSCFNFTQEGKYLLSRLSQPTSEGLNKYKMCFLLPIFSDIAFISLQDHGSCVKSTQGNIK